jgi:hypothetical protein
MSEEAKAAPVPAAESGTESQKSGNISVEGLTAMLLRESAKAPAPVPAEAQATAPETQGEAPAEPEVQPEAQAKPEAEAKEVAPEGEAPKEVAPDAEAEGDDLSQEHDGFDDDTKARVSKIVSKRLAREKAKAAEKLTALEAQVAQAAAEAAAAKARADELVKTLEAARPMPVYDAGPNDPLAKAEDLSALQAEYNKAKTALRDAEELLDQGVPEEGIAIGQQTFTESDLKAIRRNAKRLLEDQIPAKAQFIQAKQGWTQKASAEFTYLGDKNSQDYVKHMAAYQSLPMLRGLPNADYIIGAVLAYEKSKEQKSATKPVAVPAKKAPASQVASSAAPVVRTREANDTKSNRDVDQKKQAILKKGNLTAKDAAAYFALQKS